MDCNHWLEPISAAADGELAGDDLDRLHRHLDTCVACRTLADRFDDLRRRSLVRSVAPHPELAAAIVAQHHEEAAVRSTLRRRGLAASLGVAAACLATWVTVGQSAPAPAPAPELAAAGDVAVVQAAGTSFDNDDLTIRAGGSVEWMNADGVEHHLVRELGSATVAADLGPGQTDRATFTAPGTYDFYCSIHESMTGRVTVRS